MTENLKLPTNRNFGIIFSIIFLLISLYPLMHGGDIRIAFLCISFIFFLLGLFNSNILTPLNKIWLLFGIILGNFVSPVILGIIFFVVVTPIGFTMRLLNRDLLNLKKNNNNTYWINKENSNSMKDQF